MYPIIEVLNIFDNLCNYILGFYYPSIRIDLSTVDNAVACAGAGSNTGTTYLPSLDLAGIIKDPTKNISEMSLIRVIVCQGAGYGNQFAAITGMCKLRSLGFKGVFDIWCETNDICTRLTELISSTLDNFTISVLPSSNLEKFPFIRADLSFCFANDWAIVDKKERVHTYNASFFISLQPTEHEYRICYIIEEEELKIHELPKSTEMRLSSPLFKPVPYTGKKTSKPTWAEQQVSALVDSKRFPTMLLYGLQFRKTISEERNAYDINYWIVLGRLAYVLKNSLGNKTVVLFVPQKESLSCMMSDRWASTINFISIEEGVDLNSQIKEGCFNIICTGFLSPHIFHKLLSETTIPPVTEGRNAKELCNANAIPYIHCTSLKKIIPLLNKSGLEDICAIHEQACLYLSTLAGVMHKESLAEYLKLVKNKDPRLTEYHERRKEEYAQRPNSIELALSRIGVGYEKTEAHKVHTSMRKK